MKRQSGTHARKRAAAAKKQTQGPDPYRVPGPYAWAALRTISAAFATEAYSLPAAGSCRDAILHHPELLRAIATALHLPYIEVRLALEEARPEKRPQLTREDLVEWLTWQEANARPADRESVTAPEQGVSDALATLERTCTGGVDRLKVTAMARVLGVDPTSFYLFWSNAHDANPAPSHGDSAPEPTRGEPEDLGAWLATLTL